MPLKTRGREIEFDVSDILFFDSGMEPFGMFLSGSSEALTSLAAVNSTERLGSTLPSSANIPSKVSLFSL
jgi:hypothetical protein